MGNTIIKNRLDRLALIMLVFVAFSCDTDVEKLIVQLPQEDISFSNSFQANYLIDTNTPDAVAQELLWNVCSFGPSNALVRHRILGSIHADFSTIDFESPGQTANSFHLSNKELFALGEKMGLDNDPSTTDGQGSPNNKGILYYRVESFVGDISAVHAVRKASAPAGLRVEIIEVNICKEMALSEWALVGPFNNWNVVAPVVYPFLTTNTENVFVAGLSIDDQGFKVTARDGSWSKGYAYGGTYGKLVKDSGMDPVIPAAAGHYLVTIDLSSLTYSLEKSSLYGLVGPATVNSWNGPDYKFVPNECKAGTFVVKNVPLLSDVFYIRINDNWTTSYSLGDKGEGTFRINPGVGAQGIPVNESGNYDVILNMNDFTYQLIKL